MSRLGTQTLPPLQVAVNGWLAVRRFPALRGRGAAIPNGVPVHAVGCAGSGSPSCAAPCSVCRSLTGPAQTRPSLPRAATRDGGRPTESALRLSTIRPSLSQPAGTFRLRCVAGNQQQRQALWLGWPGAALAGSTRTRSAGWRLRYGPASVGVRVLAARPCRRSEGTSSQPYHLEPSTPRGRALSTPGLRIPSAAQNMASPNRTRRTDDVAMTLQMTLRPISLLVSVATLRPRFLGTLKHCMTLNLRGKDSQGPRITNLESGSARAPAASLAANGVVDLSWQWPPAHTDRRAAVWRDALVATCNA